METKKTLLEQATIAANNGNLEEWLNSLSDEDEARFKNEFSNAIIMMGNFIEGFNKFLIDELPNAINSTLRNFQDSILAVKAIQDERK